MTQGGWGRAWVAVVIALGGACGGDEAGAETTAREVAPEVDDGSEPEVAPEVAAEVEPEFEPEIEVASEVESEIEVAPEPEVEVEVEIAETETDTGPDTWPADTYCERIAESFCDYYVRCGRMAVADVAACRPVFLETCNARYEPLWVDLADRDLIAFSAAGLSACEAHLASVSCEQQIMDLDGGCAGIWQGLVPAGGACGPGLSSFVCAPGTTCVLGLDFCGSCTPLAPPEGACDATHHCPPSATCVDGQCHARAVVGAACDPIAGCILGAQCVAGTCRADTIVAVGETCDADHSCPYKAACTTTADGPRCVETMLLGQACGTSSGTAVGCASGWCDAGTCAPLGDRGAVCSTSAACVSGRCSNQRCAAIEPMCVTGP